MSSSSADIGIDVVYAESNRAILRTYRVAAPTTIADVLRLASADPAFAGIDIEHAAVGVFGRLADGGQLLRDRDRVEIYRPLSADPKLARRARVRQARKTPGSPRLRR
jgi:putative ubiquitin-RnfH superfamily antitoxin RatB of RatAB toxin-antitoxin module